uniref:ATP synthase F0 subunit 6 n=1 Tax=Epipenaeon fissurae TaxID=2995643 RepID=UPI0022FD7F8E|nr:ATP synthase F0 subunit 6 [Epipenaeon fissurae]WBK03022.1 ATP synthase F0 subunit 6 [Epipenaeon fissurae]
MLTNLFTIFDPSSSMQGIPFGWLSSLVGFALLGSSYWVGGGRILSPLYYIVSALKKEMALILPMKFFSIVIFPLALFLVILFNNIPGLFAHIFTPTSHLVVTLTFSLPVWSGLFLYSALNKPFHLLSHFVPQGTPVVLMPFMVVIETISSIIRPLTLAVRLSANMIAGHLLLALLGGAVSVVSIWSGPSGLALEVLLCLEGAVAVIQAYVFATLTSLYLSEV